MNFAVDGLEGLLTDIPWFDPSTEEEIFPVDGGIASGTFHEQEVDDTYLSDSATGLLGVPEDLLLIKLESSAFRSVSAAAQNFVPVAEINASLSPPLKNESNLDYWDCVDENYADFVEDDDSLSSYSFSSVSEVAISPPERVVVEEVAIIPPPRKKRHPNRKPKRARVSGVEEAAISSFPRQKSFGQYSRSKPDAIVRQPTDKSQLPIFVTQVGRPAYYICYVCLDTFDSKMMKRRHRSERRSLGSELYCREPRFFTRMTEYDDWRLFNIEVF